MCVFPFSASHFCPQWLVTGVLCALMAMSKLCLPVCHRQWITWTAGKSSCESVETLHHTCTHFIYSAHRCLYNFVTCIRTQNAAHSIIPGLCKLQIILDIYTNDFIAQSVKLSNIFLFFRVSDTNQ